MPNDLRSDLQAALGSGFRVGRELSGGAMSCVFVAEDVLLQREIVVKVLAPDRIAGLSSTRFQTEMQHAAQLQHPHIVPVLHAGIIEYDSGGRAPYYTMPFIRGESLRERMGRDGPLTPDEVRRILLDVVDAVAHAHSAGIAHRDLKPDNIFLVGKNALVTDFGVSEALHPAGAPIRVMGVGPFLGTPGYMAPEQAAGLGTLDHRGDLYSIGVLAYEALSGRRPFEADSVQELLVAQAAAVPVPLLQLRPSMSPALAALIMRCLEKRPEDRFADAPALLQALEQVAMVPATSGDLDRPSRVIWWRRARWAAVVLGAGGVAFGVSELWHHTEPAGTAADAHLASVALLAPQYFYADSAVNPEVAELVDRVSTELSRLEGLKVVNYMSVGAFFRRGGTPTVNEIGRALGVEHLVVFTPVGDARSPRVAVQLVEAPTQAQVWVSQFAPDSANLEILASELVSRVSHALLGPSARLPIQAHSARARREGGHAEYLAGMLALRRRTPEGVAEAIRNFERALRLDSTHVEALGRLATALALQLSYGYRTTLGSYATAARALAIAERAVALDPAHGEPVGFLAYIEYLTLAPLEKVRADFDRAIRMRVSEADVAGWNALLLLREGKIDQSLDESRRALELDPLSSVRHLTLALAALGARRYALAETSARRAGEIEPDLRRPRQVQALALLMQNRSADCVRLDLAPHLGVLAACFRATGRLRDAQTLVDSLRRLVQSDQEPSASYADVVVAQELATYYALGGDAVECLKYLRLAFARSPAGIDLRIVQSGVYDPVRRSPGFEQELQRLLDAVWPRVLEQKQRLENASSGVSMAAGRAVLPSDGSPAGPMFPRPGFLMAGSGSVLSGSGTKSELPRPWASYGRNVGMRSKHYGRRIRDSR